MISLRHLYLHEEGDKEETLHCNQGRHGGVVEVIRGEDDDAVGHKDKPDEKEEEPDRTVEL